MPRRIDSRRYGTVSAEKQKEMTDLDAVISRGRRVGTAEGRLTDSNGHLLVHGATTCLIFES